MCSREPYKATSRNNDSFYSFISSRVRLERTVDSASRKSEAGTFIVFTGIMYTCRHLDGAVACTVMKFMKGVGSLTFPASHPAADTIPASPAGSLRRPPDGKRDRVCFSSCRPLCSHKYKVNSYYYINIHRPSPSIIQDLATHLDSCSFPALRVIHYGTLLPEK